MATSTRDLAVITLIGAGAYYLTRRDPLTGRSIADGLAPGVSSSPASSPSSNRTAAIVGGATSAATLLSALLGVGGTTTAAVTGGAAAAGAGAAAAGGSTAAAGGSTAAVVGGSTGVVLAGASIAAAAAILSWGIALKGWGRGGEEAVYVNPARDAYFQSFIDRSATYGDGTYQIGIVKPKVYADIQTVRYNAFVEVARAAHVPEDQINRILTNLYAADTRDEFRAAVTDITDTFTKYETAAAVVGIV